MSRVFMIDADDPAELTAAIEALQGGGLVVASVKHERWCPKPGPGRCLCREEYRDPVANRITLARAKNKAARKARRKNR